MGQTFIRRIPVIGVVTAAALLAIATYQYPGDVHWSRVTVSLLCASTLPSGAPNSGRGISMTALLMVCTSMSFLFELISRNADTRGLKKTIQIAGIGSMVYAFLTATPMHNAMVNIALAFLLVAILAIVFVLDRKKLAWLATAGIGCIVLMLGSVSLYYTNIYADIWGVLQKLSFTLTITWLFAVFVMTTPRANRDITTESTEDAEGMEFEAAITRAAR